MTFRTVILAAGHGGGDPGATFGTETEAADAIAIVNACAAVLIPAGVPTAVVPHSDNLIDEVRWVNQRHPGPDCLALEIHKNAGSTSARRIEAYYALGNTARQKQASDLAALLSAETGLPGLAKNDTTTRWKSLWWCRGVMAPSILLEMDFIEQPDNQDERGRQLARAILRLRGNVVPPAPQPETATRPTLRRGATGKDVSALQVRLNVHHVTVVVDGQFGPATETGVKHFQAARRAQGVKVNGLPIEVDGVVGPATWSLLLQPAGR